MAMAPTLIGMTDSQNKIPGDDKNLGEYIFANKMIYRYSKPQRGDIIVFDSGDHWQNGEPVIIMKRVVGLPGETVDIESPYLIVNGKRVTEPSIFEKITSCQDGYEGYLHPENIAASQQIKPLPLTLGPDEYYLLGDHSSTSFDSRFTDPVHRNDILGRVIRRYYPFSRAGTVE